MTRTHMAEVMKIERASFSTPFSENLFQMELNLSVAHMFVGLDKGQVVGYFDFWHIGPEIHLINIAVSPKCRRQGIGKQFMEEMIQFAHDHQVKELILDVRESNDNAIGLYGQFGFKPMAIRDAYYQDNQENAIVMGLHL
jgi:[ribosomal protein S18]-alanine N-acetyltransferase